MERTEAPAGKVQGARVNVLALVVSYKVKLTSSDTLLSLAKQDCQDGLHLVVRDNSPAAAGNSELSWLSSTFNSVEYRHDGRNMPLSDLYNEIIDTHLRCKPEKYDYLILFDQDSILDRDFLLKMRTAALEHPTIRLLLPLVRSGLNGRLISPANLYYFKGISWKKAHLGPVKTRFTTAINSGMMISRGYLVDEFGGYSPEIPFYGTDNWLCQSVAKHHRFLYVVDTTIRHDLAQFGAESTDVKLWRHTQNTKAVRFLNREGFFRRNLCLIYTFTTSVRRAIRYRDRRFLQ